MNQEANTQQRHLNTNKKSAKEQEGDKNLLVFYIDIFRRRLWIILAIIVIVFTIGVIRVYQAPRIYEATSKVIAEKQTPQLIRMDGINDDSGGWDPEFYQTKAALVRSRAVMEMALQDPKITNMFKVTVNNNADKGDVKRTLVSMLGGAPLPPPEPWEMLAGMVRVEHLTDTHFILIKARTQDPVQGADIANAIAKAFEQYHLELQVNMQGDTFETLRREKDKEEKELKKAEKALQEFRETTKTLSITGSKEELPPVIKTLNEMNAELTSTQLKKIDLNSQMKVVDKILTEADPDTRSDKLLSIAVIKENEIVSSALIKKEAAEKKYTSLAQTYGPEHPLLKSAEADLDLVKAEYAGSFDKAIRYVENQINILSNKENELVVQYDAQKLKALEYSREMFEVSRLQNEFDRHRAILDMLAQKINQVDVGKGFSRTNIKIVENAGVPQYPISPNVRRSVLFALFFGIFLGIGVALLVEHLDETIKTPEDLKNMLGINVLGFVPKKDEITGHKSPMTDIGIINELLSSFAESIRNIRTNLQFASPEGRKVIGFVSCGPGEGKTTIAANVAVAMAMIGKKVLLIDSDMHRSMVDKSFGLAREPGLSDVLSGKIALEDVIQRITISGTVVTSLDIVCAGSKCLSPAELLGSPLLKEMTDKARDYYDWIIFDTPPILFVSDASIVSANCDGVVLVVRSGKHNRSVLNRAIDHLKEIRVGVIGSVLNMMVVSRFGRYYSDYSYHGYSKYTRDYHDTYYSSEDKKSKKSKTEEPKKT